MNNTTRDIIWIDWVKSICIFFVYWCHVIQLGAYDRPIDIPYGFFFVNAFFFVSGYLIFSKQLANSEIDCNVRTFWKKNIVDGGLLPNIIFKIAIPSIVFSTIDYVPKVLIRGEEMSLWMYFQDTFLRGTNWFTCALTVSEMIIFIFLLSRLRRIRYYVLSGAAIAIFGKYLQDNNFLILGNTYMPWFYKSGMIATIFLVLGGLFFKYEKKLDDLILRGGNFFDSDNSIFSTIFLYSIRS